MADTGFEGSRLYKIYKGRKTINGDVIAPTVHDFMSNKYEDTPLGAYAATSPTYPGGVVGSSTLFGQSFTTDAWNKSPINKNWWVDIVGNS